MYGCFHPIAFELATDEKHISIEFLLKTVNLWVWLLYGELFTSNVTHTMSDQGASIVKALNNMCPDSERHACWFHIKHALETMVIFCCKVSSSCVVVFLSVLWSPRHIVVGWVFVY